MNNVPIKGKRYPIDLSRETEDTYIAIPPLATNKDGEIVNMTTKTKLMKNGKVNIQEKIQSYHDEVDLYHILSRVANVEEAVALHGHSKLYTDLTDMPTDFHSMVNSGSDSNASFNSLSDTEKQAVLKYFGLVSTTTTTEKVEEKEVKENA